MNNINKKALYYTIITFISIILFIGLLVIGIIFNAQLAQLLSFIFVTIFTIVSLGLIFQTIYIFFDEWL